MYYNQICKNFGLTKGERLEFLNKNEGIFKIFHSSEIGPEYVRVVKEYPRFILVEGIDHSDSSKNTFSFCINKVDIYIDLSKIKRVSTGVVLGDTYERENII